MQETSLQPQKRLTWFNLRWGAQTKQLEEELGAILVVRHSRGVSVTPAGEILYKHAQTIIRSVDRDHAACRRRRLGQQALATVRIRRPMPGNKAPDGGRSGQWTPQCDAGFMPGRAARGPYCRWIIDW
jgi:hypothetical protein